MQPFDYIGQESGGSCSDYSARGWIRSKSSFCGGVTEFAQVPLTAGRKHLKFTGFQFARRSDAGRA